MIGRRFSAWQRLVAVAPLLLLAVWLPGEILVRCQMDGVLRSSCCCPAEEEAPSSQPALKSRGCCDREITVNEPTAGEVLRQSAAELVSGALALTAPLALAMDDSDRAIPAPRSQGPPRDGPSIVLLKHAYLI